MTRPTARIAPVGSVEHEGQNFPLSSHITHKKRICQIEKIIVLPYRIPEASADFRE